METFKIHIWIYMYVSTHILESPSQKCFLVLYNCDVRTNSNDSEP